jgi:hypothetical protein
VGGQARAITLRAVSCDVLEVGWVAG